jgi:ribosomal protein L28
MSENNKSALQTIEQKALRVYELTRQQAIAEEEKVLLKKSIGHLMKENLMDEHLFGLDGNSDLKVVVSARTTKKVDKEELAADLGISLEAAGKKDVLIKKVEEGKLTLSQYKGYEYEETVEQIQVRKVNA